MPLKKRKTAGKAKKVTVKFRTSSGLIKFKAKPKKKSTRKPSKRK